MTFDSNATFDSGYEFDVAYPPSLGFREEEDTALRALLVNANLTVSDLRTGQPLPVMIRWRMPERERGGVSYPLILLDYLGIGDRSGEEHRGWNLPTDYEQDTGNVLSNPSSPSFLGVVESFPIPLYLRYQVSLLTRAQIHQTTLMQRLMQPDLLPFRFGQLTCPAGTVRRLDVLDAARPADLINADGQRTFRRIWTIQVSTEVTSPVDLLTAASNVDLTFAVNGTSVT